MIVIGDVHGCFDTLMALVEKLPEGRELAFVGDLIDRGPKSLEVVEFVRSNNHHCVIGNHECMAYSNASDWLIHGGMETFSSYSENEQKWEDDLEWFKTLDYFKEFPELVDEMGRKLLISHSSAGSCWDEDKDGDEFKHAIIWNRNRPQSPVGYYNIFGHTPQLEGPLIGEDFANIDTGVYYPQSKLTAMLFPEKEIIEQNLIDDVKFKNK